MKIDAMSVTHFSNRRFWCMEKQGWVAGVGTGVGGERRRDVGGSWGGRGGGVPSAYRYHLQGL